VISLDGSRSRPIGVTIAGWALIVDAVASLIVIVITAAAAEDPLPFKVVGVGVFGAIAALEAWIGRGILRRRRWLLGLLQPPLEDAPPPSTFQVVYGTAATIAWAFVVVALVWHRPWFRSNDASTAGRP
jgi:hypothetical protein